MTPNDAQIDLLLRRHGGQARPGRPSGTSPADHLDADELNAFAEGSLPVAARSRFVSHLADCDDCRKIASQLAISTGAAVAAETKSRADPRDYSWWKRLSGFFAPMTLRYAAFAVVLIAVVGVAVLVIRRPREANLIAQNEPANPPSTSAVRPPDSAPPVSLVQAGKDNADRPAATASAAASPIASKPESKAAEAYSPPPAPPALKPETPVATSPELAARKGAEPAQLPSYAPAPPGDVGRAGNVSSERQETQRNAPSGPRKSESPYGKYSAMDQSRAGDLAKDNRAQDDSNRASVNQMQSNTQNQNNVQRNVDEKAQTRSEADARLSRDRNASESQRPQASMQSGGAAKRDAATSEEAPETRSAGGRKFRRQGNGWVDSKFKSTMTLKRISRESSEFDALDAGLRAIAQQIGGEVIVVWKNKAYLIR